MEHGSSCDDVKPLLSSYFDNELDENNFKTVVDHLNICLSCNKELDAIRNLSRLLKEYASKIPYYDNNVSRNVVNRINNHRNLTCNEVLEELSAYFDGEVNLKLHYLIKEHLNNCPDCNKELIKLEKLSNNVKAVLNQDNGFNNTHICWGICERLSPFLDKELPKDEMSEISQHLLTCKYCRREYVNLKHTQQTIKEYLTKSLPHTDNSTIFSMACSRFNHIQKQKELLRSSVALAIIALLSWFAVNSEPALIQSRFSIDPIRISYAKTYLRSEDFLFSKVYSIPSEGVVPDNYENN